AYGSSSPTTASWLAASASNASRRSKESVSPVGFWKFGTTKNMRGRMPSLRMRRAASATSRPSPSTGTSSTRAPWLRNAESAFANAGDSATTLERLARRRPDRERHRVARLPRDDPDGLVDERAVDLVLVAACAFGQRRDRTAAHRGQDLDGPLASQIALGQESGVLAVDEYVHEAPERAVPQDPRRELGIPIRDLARELRKIIDVEVESRVAAGCGAQRCSEAHGDRHASTSAYAARNSSASAAIAGKSELAASVPL